MTPPRPCFGVGARRHRRRRNMAARRAAASWADRHGTAARALEAAMPGFLFHALRALAALKG